MCVMAVKAMCQRLQHLAGERSPQPPAAGQTVWPSSQGWRNTRVARGRGNWPLRVSINLRGKQRAAGRWRHIKPSATRVASRAFRQGPQRFHDLSAACIDSGARMILAGSTGRLLC